MDNKAVLRWFCAQDNTIARSCHKGVNQQFCGSRM